MATEALNADLRDDDVQRLNTLDVLNEEEGPQLPTVATPEEVGGGGGNVDISDREAAAAAAEVSVMGQTSRVQRRDTTGEEAMIGATADGVGAFEMVDEVGELVKDRFLNFLME